MSSCPAKNLILEDRVEVQRFREVLHYFVEFRLIQQQADTVFFVGPQRDSTIRVHDHGSAYLVVQWTCGWTAVTAEKDDTITRVSNGLEEIIPQAFVPVRILRLVEQ
jgi:hypothetical protein